MAASFCTCVPRRPLFPRLGSLCRALLSGVGEATGTALSREVLRAYERMDREGRKAFFEMLATDFGPDASAIRAAAEEYLRSNDADALLRLIAAVEPPRQELFRRINMAPEGYGGAGGDARRASRFVGAAPAAQGRGRGHAPSARLLV